MSLLFGVLTTHAQDSDDAIFVRADATTDPDNEGIGDSWETAYASLSRALQNLGDNDEIWLAQGTYVPTETPSDRDSSFVISSDIKLFGGFEGNEENFDERPTPVDPAATVLSGDIDGDGTLGGNSYHVVVLDGVTNGTRLEGVAITGGNANETGNENGGGVQCRNLCLPRLENVIIEGNYASNNGGGLHLQSEGAQITPTLRNVIVRGNEAGQWGGGLHLEGGAVGALATIRAANTVFQGNRATRGGGIAVDGVAAATVAGEFYNTTVHGNEATDSGGGVYHRIEGGTGGLLFTNSILAGSQAGSSGNEVFQNGSLAAEFEASLIQGAFEGGSWDSALGTNVGGNTGARPLFAEATNPQNAPTTEGDVRLNWASPAIDRGVSSLIPSDPLAETEPFYEQDLAGNDRVLGNELDMGAYEGGITPSSGPLFVDASAGDETGGSEWTNPYRTLQGALQALHNARAAAADGVDVGSLDGEVAIWVAEGTYTPDDGPGFQSGDTSIPPEVLSFVIPDGTRVLGGFSGGETDASQRNPDPATNNTVLSGELGAETNSNMVAVLDAPISGAVGAALQGFTVSDGRLPDLGENEFPGPGPEAQQSAEATSTSQPPPAPRAAGVYVRGGAPELEGLRIIDNTSESTDSNIAAGLYCENCSATFESVRFQNNTSAVANGGMAVLADGQSITLTLSEATFLANSATEAGGGLSFESRSGGTLNATVANLTVQDNEAGGTAAGMAFGASSTESSTTIRVANALVTGNQITGAGSFNPPVEAEGLFVFANGGGQTNLEFAQSTWRASEATRPVIGSTLNAESALAINNSIIGGSEAPVQSESTEAQEAITINSSLVEGGWVGAGTNNIDAAPELTSEHRPEGNSPTIDAGDSSLLPADALDLNDNGDTEEPLPVDRTGTTNRVLAEEVDMGAFEGGATPRALTEPATNVGPDSTTLNALANPYSTDPVDYAFAVREEGATNPLLTEPAEESPLTGTSNTAITAEVDGLDPETAYEYRIEASGNGETTFGTWASFTTEEAPPPDATDDTFEVTANASLTINLLNLVDGLGFDIDVSSFTVVDEPSYGTVEIVNGEATYTPDEGYVGSDSFTYTVANVLGVVSAEAEVFINVTADAPVASDDSYTTPFGEILTVDAPGVLGNDELGSPEAELVNWRANSSDQPFNDPVSFEGGTLTFSDDGSLVLEGNVPPGAYTVTYTIENTADASTAAVTLNVDGEAPIATDDSYTTNIGETLGIDAPGLLENDDLGSPEADLTTIIVGETDWNPGDAVDFAGGTLTVESSGQLTLENPAEVGDFTFDYTVENAEGRSTATVTITIIGNAPVASDASFDTQVNETLTAEAPGLLENDDLGSPEADLTTITVGGTDWNPGNAIDFAGGTLTVESDGSFTFEAPTDVGSFDFAYTLENTVGTSTAMVTISVGGTVPVASGDSYTTQAGEVLTVDAPGVLGNDELGSPEAALTDLTVDGTTVAPGESADLAGGTLTVQADGSLTLERPSQVGDAAFDYAIENAEGSSTASVTISIEEPPAPEPTPAPLAPTAVGVPGTPQQVQVNNTGEVALTNVEAELDSEEHFQITEAGPADEVAPGESFTVTLVFDPQEAGTQNTQLNIASDGLPVAAFALSGKALNVSIVPDSPTAGRAFVIEVRVSNNFAPSETQRLEARRGGATDYQTFQLTEAEPGRWTATLPDNLVTTRGIDLFIVLSDEAGTVVVPEASEDGAATQPQHIQVGVPTIPAEGAFAAEQYQMISVPVELQDATTGDILTDAYGPYDTNRWRFFAWNPEQERYAEFPEADDIGRGQAAWLITEDGEPFEVENGQSFAADAPHEITLQPGWNQISSPFGFSVNWSETAPPEPIEAPVTYEAPSAESPPEYVYNQEQLEPWRGYFVFNGSSSPVSITVPPIAAGGEADEQATVARSSVDPDAASYSVQITANLEGREDQHTQTFVGFVGRNTEAHPRTFTAAPPVSPYVRTTIVDGETRYAGHYVDTPTEGYAWDIEVEANTAGAFRTDHRVRVRLNETGTLPDNFRRYVIDLDNERRVDVQNQAFTAVLNGGNTHRRYRIVVGTKAFAEQTSDGIPLDSYETTLHTNYPNPVRGATTIEYELAEPGEVTIEIYNVLGQRVRRLVDREREAGSYTVRWNGRNDAGQRVASGPYFYRMQAHGVSTARQMTVVR